MCIKTSTGAWLKCSRQLRCSPSKSSWATHPSDHFDSRLHLRLREWYVWVFGILIIFVPYIVIPALQLSAAIVPSIRNSLLRPSDPQTCHKMSWIYLTFFCCLSSFRLIYLDCSLNSVLCLHSSSSGLSVPAGCSPIANTNWPTSYYVSIATSLNQNVFSLAQQLTYIETVHSEGSNRSAKNAKVTGRHASRFKSFKTDKTDNR